MKENAANNKMLGGELPSKNLKLIARCNFSMKKFIFQTSTVAPSQWSTAERRPSIDFALFVFVNKGVAT
jgi:hypothetical protein